MNPRFWTLLSLLIVIVSASSCNQGKVLRTVHVTVDSLSQIELVNDTLVRPIIYTNVSGLEVQPAEVTKKLFISIMLPAILIAKHDLNENRNKVLELRSKKRWNQKDSAHYNDFKFQYKATDIDNLLKRMTPPPNSIVLAQAAIESGWGQSRFFREGNNVFGIWSYNPDEPRLKASIRRPNAAVHVRAYKDISHSILDYFKTIGKANAYRELRTALQDTNDPYELLPFLKYYSEKRLGYVNQLRLIMEQNNLTQYDNYRIDPSYFVTP